MVSIFGATLISSGKYKSTFSAALSDREKLKREADQQKTKEAKLHSLLQEKDKTIFQQQQAYLTQFQKLRDVAALATVSGMIHACYMYTLPAMWLINTISVTACTAYICEAAV